MAVDPFQGILFALCPRSVQGVTRVRTDSKSVIPSEHQPAGGPGTDAARVLYTHKFKQELTSPREQWSSTSGAHVPATYLVRAAAFAACGVSLGGSADDLPPPSWEVSEIETPCSTACTFTILRHRLGTGSGGGAVPAHGRRSKGASLSNSAGQKDDSSSSEDNNDDELLDDGRTQMERVRDIRAALLSGKHTCSAGLELPRHRLRLQEALVQAGLDPGEAGAGSSSRSLPRRSASMSDLSLSPSPDLDPTSPSSPPAPLSPPTRTSAPHLASHRAAVHMLPSSLPLPSVPPLHLGFVALPTLPVTGFGRRHNLPLTLTPRDGRDTGIASAFTPRSSRRGPSESGAEGAKSARVAAAAAALEGALSAESSPRSALVLPGQRRIRSVSMMVARPHVQYSSSVFGD